MSRVKECQLNKITVESGHATLTCPTTEERGDGEGFTASGTDARHWKRYDKRATRRVKKLAGSAACNGCRYFGMSPAEVDELKGREASAKALRIVGENALLKATAERAKLLAELGATATADVEALAFTEANAADSEPAQLTAQHTDQPEQQPPAEQPPTIEG